MNKEITDRFVKLLEEDQEEPETYFSRITEDYPELPLDLLSIFRYPCEVGYRDMHSALNEDLAHGPITTLLKRYTNEGTLNRLDVLRESLAATLRNFKKEQLGWFIDFFQAMEPTEEVCLGETLGRLLANNSTAHNRQLLLLVESCLAAIEGKSLRNSKKLQEIHRELVAQDK